MLTRELEYELPDSLIATHPVEPRDACRLLVVSRSDPGVMEHRTFRDLPEYLRPGDLMVFNTSGVLPAKVQGRRANTGAQVEGLFIKARSPGVWELMLKTGTKLRPGTVIELDDAHGTPCAVALRIEERADERWVAMVLDSTSGAVIENPEGEVLARVGATPLPPYIRRARKDAGDTTDDDLDRAWYQCVYAEGAGSGGSVAAPTAGLHFTPGLLARLNEMGVGRADVRLHVGIGTFKPVDAQTVEEHPIHAEWIDVPGVAARAVEHARASGNRVVAVGTTAVRTLESLPTELTAEQRVEGFRGETSLFVTPGFAFRRVDALVTNFHLPRSTLLAMVGAMFEGGGAGPGGRGSGVRRLLEVYRAAVREKYRFYSYGDAMLVLP